MTRRRIIAGVVLLAAVAVCIPLVPAVLQEIAYEEVPVSNGRMTVELGGGVEGQTRAVQLFVRRPNSS